VPSNRPTYSVVKTRKSGLARMGLILCLSAGLSANAFAQNDDKNGPVNNTVAPSQGLSLNLYPDGQGTSALLPSIENSLVNLPAESLGSTIFDLDTSNTDCLTGAETCLRRSEALDLGYSHAFASRNISGLDLTLTPRAALRFNDDGSSALVGAVVEIGEDLREGDLESDTWYFFAGADAEALSYSPNSLRRMTSGQFHLQDRIIVGDAQAGLGYRVGDADVTLSYLRREASSEDYSFKEDAAALSFTWKR